MSSDREDDRDPDLPLGAALPAQLPSGRRISLHAGERGEVLEVTAPDGRIELAVELTANGPVFRLQGAKLEIQSDDQVSLRCRRLDLRASEGIDLEAGGDLRLRSRGEFRMKSDQQAFLDADYVNLNCLDRTGYHDEGVDYGYAPEFSPEVSAGERATGLPSDATETKPDAGS